ncbi:MAG: hypothetical protein K0Q56_1199, partial [Sporolactobacillus laevolacticus]|nr:hypothetical protein [Sporolactobacillus laevolacticus]
MEINELLHAIDKDKALSFLQSLVRINSVNPPGNERLMTEYIAETFRESGLTVEKYPLDADRENVFLTLKGSESSPDQMRKSLVLSGHLDTVPIGNGQ